MENKIQAKNLRVGVQLKGTNKIITVNADIIKDFELTPITFNNFYSPIELTEDVLVKCGFERKGYTSAKGKLALHHPEPMYPKGRVYFNSWAILNEMPKYLHTLQNLYHSLTGEELIWEGNDGEV